MWVIKRRRAGYNMNTELVSKCNKCNSMWVKVRWLFNLATSALPPLCYKCSSTNLRWQPKTPLSPLQCIKSEPTRNHWGCWCLRTPGDIDRSIRPRGRTTWESGSSRHRRDRGSLGQWELWEWMYALENQSLHWKSKSCSWYMFCFHSLLYWTWLIINFKQ